MSSRIRGLHLVILLAALPGCGGAGITPVQGLVTLEGTPVTGATVLFMPDGSEGRPATGFTTPDGTFRLTTYKTDDGAAPGQYRVVIQKSEAAKDRDKAALSALERAKAHFEDNAAQQAAKPLLPQVYATFETTPLRCTVPATGVVTLDLKKDGKQSGAASPQTPPEPAKK
jgi:hypothetical protein